MTQYSIIKDKILNKWIIWETHPNYKFEVYRGRTKKECMKYYEENLK